MPPSTPMPIAGCSARHIRGPSTLIARAPERAVQFRLHKILDEPPHPISDHRLDRVKPGRPQNLRRRARQVSAILRHGVISIGVSPPSLARFTSRRLHHSEFQPLSRRNRPQFKGVTDSGSAEASYYTWVDQFNTF